jgi:hypothetical protein
LTSLEKEAFRASSLLQVTILFLRVPQPPIFSYLNAHLFEANTDSDLTSTLSSTEVWLTYDSKYGSKMALINVQWRMKW